MNRAEATLALIAGKKVEREYCGRAVPLRFDPVDGLQYQNSAGKWYNEAGASGSGPDIPGYRYREVWEPRVFLGAWEEVKTFEEAEPATSDGEIRVYVDGVKMLNTGSAFALAEESPGYWVRRKPDAAKACPNCQVTHAALAKVAKECDEAKGLADRYVAAYGECNERVKLLNGLLDEVMRWLDDRGTFGTLALANDIRRRRAGK